MNPSCNLDSRGRDCTPNPLKAQTVSICNTSHRNIGDNSVTRTIQEFFFRKITNVKEEHVAFILSIVYERTQ